MSVAGASYLGLVIYRSTSIRLFVRYRTMKLISNSESESFVSKVTIVLGSESVATNTHEAEPQFTSCRRIESSTTCRPKLPLSSTICLGCERAAEKQSRISNTIIGNRMSVPPKDRRTGRGPDSSIIQTICAIVFRLLSSTLITLWLIHLEAPLSASILRSLKWDSLKCRRKLPARPSAYRYTRLFSHWVNTTSHIDVMSSTSSLCSELRK